MRKVPVGCDGQEQNRRESDILGFDIINIINNLTPSLSNLPALDPTHTFHLSSADGAVIVGLNDGYDLLDDLFGPTSIEVAKTVVSYNLGEN